MGKYTKSKQIVLNYFDEMERCTPEQCRDVLLRYASEDLDWKGVYPFRQQYGPINVAETFWTPLKHALPKMQRRMDIFIAG